MRVLVDGGGGGAAVAADLDHGTPLGEPEAMQCMVL